MSEHQEDFNPKAIPRANRGRGRSRVYSNSVVFNSSPRGNRGHSSGYGPNRGERNNYNSRNNNPRPGRSEYERSSQGGEATNSTKGLESVQATQDNVWKQKGEERSWGTQAHKSCMSGEQNGHYDQSKQPRYQDERHFDSNRRGNQGRREEKAPQFVTKDVEGNDTLVSTPTSSNLNPSAAVYKPALAKGPYPDKFGRTEECLSDISLEDDSINDSQINQDLSVNQSIDETVSSLKGTSLDSSLSAQESNTSYDGWSDAHVTPNTTGKLQGSKYKANKKVTNLSPFQKDVSMNENQHLKSTSYEIFEKKVGSIISNDKYVIVDEKEADLFAVDPSYALANCIAADMNMGSGIAVTFRQQFKGIDELMAQRQTIGGLALLNVDGRFIYYLITKKESSKKPTYETLYRSLEKLKEHMVENGVKKLAIPRLGCGLDRLEWKRVKPMLEYIFTGTDVQILVCNFQKADETMSEKKEKLQSRKCLVRRVPDAITKAKPYSIIIYLGMVNGHTDDNIIQLNERFRILNDYKKSSRVMGSIVVTAVENYKYYLVGCIAKKSWTDKVDFKEFQNCIVTINKENNKFRKSQENYQLASMGPYYDPDEPQLMTHLENLLKHTLFDVVITIHGVN